MSKIKSIGIPETCSQSWEQMDPAVKGRYCGHCCKTVIDFTKMTNKEIITFLAGKTDVCGRFDQYQLPGLNYQLNNENATNRFSWKKWLVAAGLFGISFINRASAQTKTQVNVSQQPTSATSYRMLGKVLAIDTVKKHKNLRKHKSPKIKNVIPNANVQKREGEVVVAYRSDISNKADYFKEPPVTELRNVPFDELVPFVGIVGGVEITGVKVDSIQSRILMFYQYMRWPINKLFK
jgi:hypothetical protein